MSTIVNKGLYDRRMSLALRSGFRRVCKTPDLRYVPAGRFSGVATYRVAIAEYLSVVDEQLRGEDVHVVEGAG